MECATLLAQAMASQQNPVAAIQREAQMLRPYSGSESREAAPQAGTANGRLGTKVTIKEERKLHSDSPGARSQPAHCGQFPSPLSSALQKEIKLSAERHLHLCSLQY